MVEHTGSETSGQVDAERRNAIAAQNYTHMTADEQHIAETFGPIETDPNGMHQNEAGAKLDAGKNRLGLVMFGFARALQEVGRVGTYGANKYTDNGWVSVPDGESRYTDAMLRHLMFEATGEVHDTDTGLRHSAHAAWNALARLDLAIRNESTRTDAVDELVAGK